MLSKNMQPKNIGKKKVLGVSIIYFVVFAVFVSFWHLQVVMFFFFFLLEMLIYVSICFCIYNFVCFSLKKGSRIV